MRAERILFGRSWAIEHLKYVDEIISLNFPGERFSIYIVGGAALMFFDVDSKMTDDIDIISVSDEKIKPYLFTGGYVNQRVSCTSDCFSTLMDDRAIKVDIGPTLSLDIFSASLEDIISSKLYAGRGKDKKDLYNPEVMKIINWELLDQIIYEEMRIDALNERRWKDLIYEYEEYKEVYRKWQEEKKHLDHF